MLGYSEQKMTVFFKGLKLGSAHASLIKGVFRYLLGHVLLKWGYKSVIMYGKIEFYSEIIRYAIDFSEL